MLLFFLNQFKANPVEIEMEMEYLSVIYCPKAPG